MAIEDYKLFENVQKSKKILAELRIPETDERYLKLREILKKNIGYLGTFTKWVFKDRESFERIDEILKELDKVKLDKPIDSFDKLEDLYDYITEFETNKAYNQVTKALPSNARALINDELESLLKLNIEYAPLLKNWYKTKGGRYKETSALLSDTKDFINNLKGGFNLKAILGQLEGLNVEVVIKTPELLMVKVDDYEASKKIGSKHWCISTSESMWNSYVNDFTNQYFVYDFTKDISDRAHMIGCTVSPGGNITSAHWADDRSVNDLSVLDEL